MVLIPKAFKPDNILAKERKDAVAGTTRTTSGLEGRGEPTSRKRLLTVSHKLSHISFLKRHLVHQNTLKRSRSFNNLRGAERFTNQLLYQLSYVGLFIFFSLPRRSASLSPTCTKGLLFGHVLCCRSQAERSSAQRGRHAENLGGVATNGSVRSGYQLPNPGCRSADLDGMAVRPT